MIERIDHVNIVAADLSGMTAFYRDALGLRVAREIAIGGDWIEAVTGLAEVEADVVYLEAESGAALELICYRNPQGVRPAGLEQPNTIGFRHIAFHVSDLEETVARVREQDVELLSEIQVVPATQVEFDKRQKRILYCRDPEGNLVELCDFR